MKRLSVIILFAIIVCSLILAGCSSSPPASPSSNAPNTTAPATSAPAASSAPATSKPSSSTSNPSPSSTHAPVALEIYSNPFGNAGYTLSFALADLLSKNSTWLRAVAIESPSGAANLQILQRSPEKAPVWVGFCNPLSIYYSQQGGAPFSTDKPFTGKVKAVSLASLISVPFITTNPNIKTPQDMVGKTVALEPAGSTEEYVPRYMLQAWGIYDKVKIITMAFADQANALTNGTLDVGRSGASISKLGQTGFAEWAPIAPFQQLVNAKATYIGPATSPADYAAAAKASGYPIFAQGCAGKTIGKSTFPDFYGSSISNGWFVSADMPSDTVTELTRVIYQNADKFVTYLPSATIITQSSIGKCAVPKDGYHPASIAYLEAQGQSVGQ